MSYCEDHELYLNHCHHCRYLPKRFHKRWEEFGMHQFHFLGCKRCMAIFLKTKSYIPHTLLDEEVDATPNRAWLCKPIQGCQGTNITFTDDPSKCARNCVKQRMLESAKIDGHVFDIRIYMVLMQTNGNLRGFIYPDGIVRLARRTCTNTSNDSECRLTNTHQLTQKEQKKIDFFTRVFTSCECYHKFRRIQQIVKDVFDEMKHIPKPKQTKSLHHLFGLDFMMTTSGEIYLLEINTRPASVTPKNSAFVRSMKLKMYEDIGQLILNTSASATSSFIEL